MTNYIVSSGVTSSVTLLSGDTMSVFGSGSARGIKVNRGGQEFVYGGGVASSSVVRYRGSLTISTDGESHNITIEKHGEEIVSSGGVCEDSHISSNGFLVISSGGTEIGAKVYDSSETVEAGGVASNTNFLLGVFDVYGSAVGTKMKGGPSPGGYFEYVESGGVAQSNVIDGGAQILSGGTAIQTIVSGGTQGIARGSLAKNTMLFAGALYAYSGGKAIGTTISNSNPTLGAQMFVDLQGVADDTRIGSGGYELVNSGTIGKTTILGGELELQSGAIETGKIIFSKSGGSLSVQTLKMPTATISGFQSGDQIDLTAITYSAGETATVNKANIVTISAGGETYKLHIAGAVVGETDFAITSSTSTGIILSKTIPSEMPFLRPATAPAGAGFIADLTQAHTPLAAPEQRAVQSATPYGMVRETAARPETAHALWLSATAHIA